MRAKARAFVLMILMAALFLLVTGSQAIAALRSVGPVSQATGFFPAWYMDQTGEVMELCVPEPGVELQGGYCLILPADVPDAASPITFPGNWPGEAFWWSAEAEMTTPNGGDAELILALEAAFGTDTVVDGDQVSFGRLRIRIDTTVPGLYTITHPFGVRTFNVTAEDIDDDGDRAINFTEDIGIGSPGDFTGALNSVIGPFLRASATPGGEPLPYHTNPALPGKLYLADPDVPTKITGGLHNVFRVEGPPGFGTIETTDFNLVGRVFNGSPTTISRATYSRTGTSALVEAFADSALGASLTVGTVGSPQGAMQGFEGKYFGNFTTSPLPTVIEVVAAQPGKNVTRVESPVTDLITVTQAQFDRGAGVLTVTASSSDDNVASLTVEGIGSVANGGTATFTLPVPPPYVTVTSAQGGSDVEPVVVLEGEPQNQAPVAVADQYSVEAGSVLSVPAPGVLGNDVDPDGNTPLAAVLVADVSSGTLSLTEDGSFTYTPNAGFSGTDSFTYSARDTLGALSPATTVTITVLEAGNAAPVAASDSYSVNAGATLNVADPGILGNDVDPDGNLPLTAVLQSGVTNGSLTLVPNGSFTYTPNAGFSGTDSFTYSARDSLGALSPAATVTITVAAVNAPPVAANNSYTVNAGATLNVPAAGILLNDNDPDGNIPLTAVLVTNVSNGTLTLNADGSFTYTPNAGFSGLDSFTYQARDTQGALSNIATVTVTVNPVAQESIAVATAEFRISTGAWNVTGASTPIGAGTGNTITIYLGPTVGGTVIGTTTVQADGTWRFQQAGITPGTVRTISARSSSGATVQNVTLRVRF